MSDDDANDSQALTGGDITRFRALVARSWQQSGDLEAHLDADWRSDRATRRSVSAGVITRGDHCLKVWTKKQQVVALSSAESELYAAVKTASEGLRSQSVAKDLGTSAG